MIRRVSDIFSDTLLFLYSHTYVMVIEHGYVIIVFQVQTTTFLFPIELLIPPFSEFYNSFRI
nr:MAG TPA: hypothetical protein [Caudoviricetes sp.]